VIATTIARAWALGGGPGVSRLVIDIDSTICQVFGKQKHGAAYGYTKVLGYHPILATRADTGEILHARLRKGSANTARGVRRFVDDLVARARRAGASGPMVIRFDSGFWSNETIKALARHRVSYTMTVRCAVAKVAATIAAIDEHDWVDIGYTPDGRAQVAETMYGRRRLIVRRTRLVGAQAELWPDWRHHAFVTNRIGAIELVEAEHRQHGVVELVIRDLKDQALAHFPSGKFLANAAWTVLAALAHNLLRWTTLIGLPDTVIPTSRILRRRLLTVPGRITRTARQVTLRMPARWPWETQFLTALNRLRAVPALI
jgi:hypothetical protein